MLKIQRTWPINFGHFYPKCPKLYSLFELELDGPMLSFPNQICKIIKLMIESDGNKKILWIILILTTFSFFKSAAQHTVGRVVYFLKPICYLWFVEICIRRKWACSPSLATTNNSPSLETDIRRIFSCRLCQAQYSQSVSKIATSLFLAHPMGLLKLPMLAHCLTSEIL